MPNVVSIPCVKLLVGLCINADESICLGGNPATFNPSRVCQIEVHCDEEVGLGSVLGGRFVTLE